MGEQVPPAVLARVCAELGALGGQSVAAVLQRATACLEAGSLPEAARLSRVVADVCNERLYDTHWEAVPAGWRTGYTVASFALCSAERAMGPARPPARAMRWPPTVAAFSAGNEAAAMRACDLGLLLGQPVPGVPLAAAAGAMHGGGGRCEVPEGEGEAAAAVTPDLPRTPAGCAPLREVCRVHCPSVLQFARLVERGEPVVITGAVGHWAALRRWRSLEYLRGVAGGRTVPVELGQYSADAFSQRLLTLSAFIDEHVVAPRGSRVGYLAQHELLTQVPELADDVGVPDYCLEEPVVNAWFGPGGTVSPLHYDPQHNLLAQVVGAKLVRLFAAADSVAPHALPAAAAAAHRHAAGGAVPAPGQGDAQHVAGGRRGARPGAVSRVRRGAGLGVLPGAGRDAVHPPARLAPRARGGAALFNLAQPLVVALSVQPVAHPRLRRSRRPQRLLEQRSLGGRQLALGERHVHVHEQRPRPVVVLERLHPCRSASGRGVAGRAAGGRRTLPRDVKQGARGGDAVAQQLHGVAVQVGHVELKPEQRLVQGDGDVGQELRAR